ncbi:MMPL family transporter [Nocardioides lianchengensis]|uniref:Putative drug exporter of the RND superfamily n=1 Tax=Nocardioides lianchengensis TaxID=1045774 RepID=A0A1G6LXE9_9ACTN|nr:MMPL family transporter [Nocardioides lianchengensis]NYG12414.1 RND superfamily putative drug exporter [Nocardioides lianchengensis]SDC47968.1 putative drug exporter of the RND superfamily [Nocardioides lianchengensis]
MATLLHRLGKTAYRRWPFFIAAWLVAFVAVGIFAGTMSKPMTDAFSIPGIPSEKAADLQAELFPGAVDAFDQASVKVVVAAPEGSTLADPEYAGQVQDLISDLEALPQMPDTPLVDPVTAAADQQQAIVDAATQAGGDVAAARENAQALSPLSEDGRVGTITWDFDVETVADVEPETITDLGKAMDAASENGLVVEANGSGSAGMMEISGTSELIGIAVALLVLVLTFGSLMAAGLPIVTALLGVGLGITGITASTAFFDIGSTTPMLATMIGLAVGIDYTLFILARYRTELHHTDDREEAVGVAVGTAGSAVVFAGLTVLIALSALALVRIPFLTSMGLAAGATVLIAVLVALTLLPAVLGLLKKRAFAGTVRRYQPERDTDGLVKNNGVRWARLVGRRPITAVLLTVVALGALALPLSSLHLAFPTDSTASPETTQRKASDLIAESFGPGRDAPMIGVIDGRDLPDEETRMTAYADVVAWAAGQDDVQNAQLIGTNEDGTGARVMITPDTGPEDTATEDLLTALRDGQDEIEAATGTTIGITGLTAITTDVSERLSGALPIYLAVVIGLAFILLMIVFRSILIPLTATLGFLLTVLATLGATVAVFQEGAFGIMEGQPIVSFMPIFLIGLVFGLAMDYQVFLVTRMREAHVHGMSTREAVVDGFRNSARVVTAAAAIMIAVFSAFILIDEPIIRSIGFALAVAVFFDAFIVRMTLIPALMYLMGEKAWWLPAWLDRILPDVDVEGEKLDRPYLRTYADGALDGQQSETESVQV